MTREFRWGSAEWWLAPRDIEWSYPVESAGRGWGSKMTPPQARSPRREGWALPSSTLSTEPPGLSTWPFPQGGQATYVEVQGSRGKKWKFLKARPRTDVVLLLSFLIGQVSCRPTRVREEGTQSPSRGGMLECLWPSSICHKHCSGLPGVRSGAWPSGFESHCLAVQPRASDLIFLCLSFLICRMGLIYTISLIGLLWRFNVCKIRST